jgi:hypothetical protein
MSAEPDQIRYEERKPPASCAARARRDEQLDALVHAVREDV